MQVKIDQNKCAGCGICAHVCSDGIEIVDNKAIIKSSSATCLKEASEVCPLRIIQIS